MLATVANDMTLAGVPEERLAGVQSLALHPLRLSASSLRLQWSWQPSAADGELQIPVGLSADGLKIEIGREMEEPL